jgi:hypothetical protein
MKKAYYPMPESQTQVDANLLGPCGFYCGYCLAFKEGTCLGCRYQAEKKETAGVVKVFCDLLSCSSANGVDFCAQCSKYPCEKYDPEKCIFSKGFIDYLKTDARKH